MSPKKKSPLTIVFFIIFLDLVGFGIVLPLSPFYAEYFGASPTQVGLLQASYSLMQFLFAPLWGGLSDRIGRRPILLMSLFGSTLSYLSFACASTLEMLFAARIFQGIFAANIGAAQAYVADVTEARDRSKGMGLVGAAFGLGFIFGPAIGAALSEAGPAVGQLLGFHGGPFGMGFPALVASVLCFLNLVFAFFRLPESLSKEKRNETARESRWTLLNHYLSKPKVSWVFAVFFLSTFAIANMEATLALFAERRFGYGVAETGKLFAFVGVMMALTQGFFIRKLLPKLGEKKLLIMGSMITAIGFGAVSLAMSQLSLYMAMTLVAVGGGLANPAVLGILSLLTSSKEQGEAMGVNQSLGSLARVLGPACGGWIFALEGTGAPYVLASVVSVFTLLLIIKNSKLIPAGARNRHV